MTAEYLPPLERAKRSTAPRAEQPPPPDEPPRSLPPPHEPAMLHEPEQAAPSTWQPVDLTDALAGHDVPPPSLLERSDGLHLLYPGRVHWFSGESESCKSWVAQHAAAVELTAGNRVLYIDYEDDDRSVVARLLAMDVAPDAIRAGLTYVRPDEALADRYGNATRAAADLARLLDDEQPGYTLAIIDGVTEAMTIEGLELIDNADVARFMRTLPKRLAAAGAAVVAIDHVPKSTDASSRYALGGQHKLAGLDGCGYRFTTRRPFARAYGADPIEGEVAVTVTKDRPGYIRGRTRDGDVGVAHLSAYPDGSVRIRLEPPGSVGPDRDMIDAILGYLDSYDGSSGRQVTEGVEGKADRIRGALRWMVDDGLLRVEPKGRSHLHWLTDAGREAPSVTATT